MTTRFGVSCSTDNGHLYLYLSSFDRVTLNKLRRPINFPSVHIFGNLIAPVTGGQYFHLPQSLRLHKHCGHLRSVLLLPVYVDKEKENTVAEAKFVKTERQ